VNCSVQKQTKRKRTTASYTLLCSAAWELPHLRGCKDVHHCLIAYLHREEFRYLHVPAPAFFPANFPPNCFSQFVLLILPLSAVAEEILPCLGHLPTLPALIIASLAESYDVCCCGGLPTLELVATITAKDFCLHRDRSSTSSLSALILEMPTTPFLILHSSCNYFQ